MAIAALIKNANTPMKTVGDIVGIFEDSYKFEDNDLVYSFAKIEGKRAEVFEKLNALNILMANAYKSASNKWSFTKPERRVVWQDIDEDWYFLDAPPKYKWSMSLLSETEKTTLENDKTGIARDSAFKKMIVNPGVWDAKNTVAVKDLNI